MIVEKGSKRVLRALYKGLLRQSNKFDPPVSAEVQFVIRERFRQSKVDTARGFKALRELHAMDTDDVVVKMEQMPELSNVEFTWADGRWVKSRREIKADKSTKYYRGQKGSLSTSPGMSRELEKETITRELDRIKWVTDLTKATSAVDEDGDVVSLDERNSTSSSSRASELSELPLFPLSGPTLTFEDDTLPLFGEISEIPVSGMEIPLRIFEPRYCQMYQDLLAKPKHGSRSFVVPLPHPIERNHYAEYAWLYEIMSVKDVADQSNGLISYAANHLVTKPVKIHRIINPEAWDTKDTYLRIEADVLDDPLETKEDIFNLSEWLSECENERSVYEKLSNGLRMDGLWGAVRVWLDYLQTELLRLQVEIAAEVKLRGVELLREIQAPHRSRLLDIQLELGILVPRLHSMASSRERSEYLLDRLQGEKDRLDHKKHTFW